MINKIKPIFIVGISEYDSLEMMEELQDVLTKRLPDYHVLVYYSGKDDITFQVFFEKDFNEVKFEELKEIVKRRLT